MGLDMYLEKRTYVRNWSHNTKRHKLSIKFDGKERTDIKKDRVTGIVEEVAYWRKCHNIHNWFCDQFDGDGSGTHYIEKENLVDLLSVCEEVLKGGDNEHGLEGDEAEITAKQLRKLLKEKSSPDGAFGGDFYYHASW